MRVLVAPDKFKGRLTALVGRLALTQEQATSAGFADVRALTELQPDLQRCRREAAGLFTRSARILAETSPLLRPDRFANRL